MSALNTSKLVTKAGTIGGTTTPDVVDYAGNLKSSPQFIVNKIVDYSGNLGKLTTTGPWEMQLGTVETVGADGGTISTNYINAGNLTNFTSADCIGYMAGNISGSSTFNIKNGPQTIGGVSYPGNGTTIFTGTNTCTGILNMEANTNIKLGANCTNAVTKWNGNLTIGAGATATQYNGWNVSTYLCQALTNTGTYNIIGCGTCGIGGVGLATTVANNGTINIDKTSWRGQSTHSGTGTINVLSGGTFQLSSNAINNLQTVNINGDGWCAADGITVGALHGITGGTNHSFKINVQSATTIKTASGVSGVGLGGVLSGTAPLTVTSLSAGVGGGFVIYNAANTYSGTLTVDKMTLDASSANSLQFASVVLANGGRLSSSATQTIKSLAGTDSTSYWIIGDALNCFIKNNGITTYAGKMLSSGGSGTSNVWMEGPSTNQLTMTATGNNASIFPRGGSKLILQGATFVANGGQVRVSGGSTVSAGTSTTASCTFLYIDATSALDVWAAGAGTGLIKATSGFSMTAGWKINALDPLAVGVYPIIQKPNTVLLTPAPTLGINNTGHTVTFTQVGNFVNMVVS